MQLYAQAVTSACIAGVSDLIAQAILGTPYRPSRTLKMMVRSTGPLLTCIVISMLLFTVQMQGCSCCLCHST